MGYILWKLNDYRSYNCNNKLFLLVYDDTEAWPGEQEIVISGPASDRDEAIKVGKEVTKNIPWVYSESKDW